jgi:hypothetical protein
MLIVQEINLQIETMKPSVVAYLEAKNVLINECIVLANDGSSED